MLMIFQKMILGMELFACGGVRGGCCLIDVLRVLCSTGWRFGISGFSFLF